MLGPTAALSSSAPAELQPSEMAVAVQPSQSPRSARFEGGARRLVAAPESPRVQRSPRMQTMEDMDRRIEEDALALINMKREILESQKAEVSRAQQTLAVMRKEHDTLHMENERVQRQIESILDRAHALETVDRGVKAAGNATQDLCNNMNKQLGETGEMQESEMRTLRMHQHMLSRLESEISELRAQSAKTTFKLDTLRHEIVATENTLIVSKQERGAQDHKLNEMKKTIEGLNKERNSKLGMMQSIIDEGEHSLSMVQGSVFESTIKSPRSRGSNPSRGATRESPTRTEELEDFELVEGKPEVLAKRLSVQKVREMVDRYMTRESRMDKLAKLESDLRDKIASERHRKAELQERIDDIRAKHHAIASSRTKMYKDMDEMANAQWKAKKACDEAYEREHRLRSGIESIKRAIPRFLSKLTKAFVPVPGVEDVSLGVCVCLCVCFWFHPQPHYKANQLPRPSNLAQTTRHQLPDVIQKLEDEILRIFKAIGAAVQKDTPAEEIAAVTQNQPGSSAAQGGGSEITRLQKLPGFSQLQRTLYYNMMAAKPDNSVNNVRVSAAQSRKGKREDKEGASGLKGNSIGHLQLSLSRATGTEYPGAGGSMLWPGSADDDVVGFVPQGLSDLHDKEGPSLEGDLIKRISNLVIERDGGGWSKVLERRAFEERQRDVRLEKKRTDKTKRRIGVW